MRLRRVGFAGFIAASAALSLSLLVAVSGASADTLGPTFTAHSPASGSVLPSATYIDVDDYYGHIPISVTVTDPDGVPDQVWGGTVSTGGYNFGFYPTATRLSANSVRLTEQNTYVADGLYQVTANARDLLGNTASTSWSFTLDQGYPSFSSWGPTSDSWKANDPIFFDVSDVGSGVSTASVIMTVDGVLVTPSMNVSGSTLSAAYVPVSALALGPHTVSVSCQDLAGHPVSKTWTFSVVAANTGPQVIYERPSTGFLLMDGGYWNYDDYGDPTTYVQPSAYQSLTFVDADVIERTSVLWQVSDSANTTTRTVTPGTSWTNSDKRVFLSTSTSPVIDGQVFSSRITVADKLGAVTVYDRTFMVYKDAPYATEQSPSQGVHQSLTRPTISVTYRDSSAGIDAGSIVMTLDGQPLATTTTAVTNGYAISGVPETDLSGGSHTVVVTCADGFGVPGTSTWSFFVDLPTPPVFSEVYPGNLGVVDVAQGAVIAAKVFDADGIMAGSQMLTLSFPSGETTQVTPWMGWDDEWAGTPWESSYARIFYVVPTSWPEGGPITATLSAMDMSGMLGTHTWVVSYIRDRPKYYSRVPAASGVTTSTSPVISARVTDSSGINPDSVRGYLDGVEVPCELLPVTNGYQVSYAGASFLQRSTHEFRIYAEDTLGSFSPEPGWGDNAPAWSFYVAVEPQPSAHMPVPGSTATTDCPTISVAFDEFEGLNSGTASLTIDGVPVTPQVVMSDANRRGTMTYSARLSPGTHTVSARISSSKGVPGTGTWSFTVPGLAEMTYLDNGNSVCITCHASPTNTERRLEITSYWRDHATSRAFDDIHNATLLDNYHNNNCQKCHSKMAVAGKTNCEICHVLVNGSLAWPADGYRLRDGQHGNTFSYTYLDRSTPGTYEISSPRTWDDCLYCHQVQPTFAPTVAKHDMTQGHTIEFPDGSCVGCHDAVLTREHAKLSALDSAGAAMACGSCHGSQDTTVAAVSMGMPTYRFSSEASGFEPDVVDATWMDHSQEFAIPGAQITGFTLSMRASYATSYSIEAWYSGAWVHVSSTLIPAGNKVDLTNYANGNNYLDKTTTVNVSLPAPTDKVRLGLRTFSGKGPAYRKNVEARITHVATTAAPVTCSSCHASGHPHPAADVSALANGQRACSVCHSGDVVVEHLKPTSSSATDACDACHATGGARESITGAWDRTCDTAGCHDAAGTRAVHENYCLACHDVSQPDFSVAKTSFPAVTDVNRDTACKACHAPGLVGTHPYHQSGSNCGAACHPGWGTSLVSATPLYSDPVSGASFGNAGSKSTPAALLHTIHANPRWPATFSTATSVCSSCHATAACNACHTGAVPSTHAEHSATDQTANPAWTGVVSYGVIGGDQTQRTAFTDTVQCASPECHDLATSASAAPHGLEDYNYTIGTNPDDPDAANSAISTLGTWRWRASNRYTGGRMSYANVAGATLAAVFTGERVEVVSDMDPYRGRADVFVDGVVVGSFDSYAPTTRFQVPVFSVDVTPGAHVITVRPTGAKSDSARAAYVVVDAFRVYTSAPQLYKPECTSCHTDRAGTHW